MKEIKRNTISLSHEPARFLQITCCFLQKMPKREKDGPMLKSEEWVSKEARNEAEARFRLRECNDKLRQCEKRRKTLNIHNANWIQRKKLLLIKMAQCGWNQLPPRRKRQKKHPFVPPLLAPQTLLPGRTTSPKRDRSDEETETDSDTGLLRCIRSTPEEQKTVDFNGSVPVATSIRNLPDCPVCGCANHNTVMLCQACGRLACDECSECSRCGVFACRYCCRSKDLLCYPCFITVYNS